MIDDILQFILILASFAFGSFLGNRSRKKKGAKHG